MLFYKLEEFIPVGKNEKSSWVAACACIAQSQSKKRKSMMRRVYCSFAHIFFNLIFFTYSFFQSSISKIPRLFFI